MQEQSFHLEAIIQLLESIHSKKSTQPSHARHSTASQKADGLKNKGSWEITKQIDQYLSAFESPKVFDESTIRKKLKEYVNEGIIEAEKCGKTLYYKRSDQVYKGNTDILDYFSETAPCGVIGSFLLDQQPKHKGKFAFKHHYITGTMDSDMICQLFEAMQKKSSVTIQTLQKRTGNLTKIKAVPLQIFISVQNGRQYLMAYSHQFQRISIKQII